MRSLTELYTELEPYVTRLSYSPVQLQKLKISLEEVQEDLENKMRDVTRRLAAIGMAEVEAKQNVTRIVDAIQQYVTSEKMDLRR